MRNAFIDAVTAAAAADPRLMLLVADNGALVFDDFRARFPAQFLNLGICEQNLVGVAAGLALAGRRPIAYTIIPFLIARAAEQVRVDLALQGAPVLLVGIGAGLAYSTLGPTHHAVEDIAWVRALPGMRVVVPSDPPEVRQAVPALLAAAGPSYLRLGLNGEPAVLPADYRFTLGRGTVLRRGRSLALLVCGPIVEQAVQAADQLAAQGFHPTIAIFSTVKPLDEKLVRELAGTHRRLFTVEEHSVLGGFGGAVAEVIAAAGTGTTLHRFGLADRWTFAAGNRTDLLAQHGLLAKQLVETIMERCRL